MAKSASVAARRPLWPIKKMKIIVYISTMILVFGCHQQQSVDYDLLSEMNSDWTHLTETDSGLVIFNSCDMGNLEYKIYSKNDTAYILLHGTQEDQEFRIVNLAGTKKDLVIETENVLDNHQQSFKFKYVDETKGIANWITTYPNDYTSDLKFVSARKASDFPTINQPCVECWGEECDEIEN
ncbi:hypothetical protein PZB74_18755 [Porifericola rhodea]|uniref:hypothetical protein n=1 Tax=Porifericola rhodea TaxID=930972 RepID=UPI00266657EB|nr:hypothetical protein [Porifericola rhodea]WKN30993.1 hypothetical protein PZB74_18755 [Porifericola rhodea]